VVNPAFTAAVGYLVDSKARRECFPNVESRVDHTPLTFPEETMPVPRRIFASPPLRVMFLTPCLCLTLCLSLIASCQSPPAKSNTAARTAYDELLAALDLRNLSRDKRIAYLEDFQRDWQGTSAAIDAQKQIARLRELETLAAEAAKAYAALESRESTEVITKSQADLRRAAWDDYLAKYAATEHQVAEARQRRNYWAAWEPVISEDQKEGRRYLNVNLGGGVTMNMVYIHSGTFKMGLSKIEQDILFIESENGRDRLSGIVFRALLKQMGPQTRVALTDDFWMGETEVAVGQFKRFVSETSHRTTAEKVGWANGVSGSGSWGKMDGLSWRFPGFDQTDAHPVVCVSWEDAVAFCEWASRKSGMKVTLPTEAQWEYACRAGTTGHYFLGDSDSSLGDYYWCKENSGLKTQPIKTKKPNAWGLYDMRGNVWEWCLDWCGDSPDGSVTNPTGPSSGGSRVRRGGSWGDDAEYCRSAMGGGNAPTNSNNNHGFRVIAIPRP
jgi:formylglycine-generating enzyme required for sulfatase activity